MNPLTRKLLTRKDIAEILGVSVWVVRANERRLGLYDFRAAINSRVVLYQAWRVIPHLAKRGLLLE